MILRVNRIEDLGDYSYVVFDADEETIEAVTNIAKEELLKLNKEINDNTIKDMIDCMLIDALKREAKGKDVEI